MNSKPIRSRTAVTLLVVFALLLTWLGAMFFTTGLTAESVYNTVVRQFYSDYLMPWSPFSDTGEEPETDTRSILHRLDNCNDASVVYSTSFDSLGIPLQIAVTVTDGQGNLLFESGDYLYFNASSQQQWDAGELPGWNSEFYYIPLERNELYAPLYELYEEQVFVAAERRTIMRIKGYPDGEEFIPVQIDYVPEKEGLLAYERYAAQQGYSHIPAYVYEIPMSQLQEYFSWTPLLQRPDTGDTPLTTIYTYSPQMTVYSGTPVIYQGTQYNNLLDVLYQNEISADYTLSTDDEDRLDRMSQFSRFYLLDPQKPFYSVSDCHMIVTCGVYANPLKGAIRSLIPVYILTGLLTVAVGWILLIILQKKLITPVEAAGCAMEQNWDPDRTDYFATWREPALLNYQVRVESRNRQAAQDKITRLETALSYAQTAEENRRQLTSHIAHELKTPLAIIHSYTEGLKEHIAEEKRDQYLDTILSETERMDAMVMEMLDLSRLEAGKVTLTRTSFSLGVLAQTVYDTFSALAQEKQLQVQLSLSDDATVLADEARIEQVIRNFLSNAVRYTPEGGTVHIKTSTQYIRLRKTVSFSVENSSHHFSQQELEKLWDSFYQADPSRSSKGTGLGLAICKNIISLHGGTCGAKNTDLGVEFSFVL